jgi:uncharacterized membrane protein
MIGDADAMRAALRAPDGDRSLRRRRWLTALGAAGLADAAVMALYQMGVIRRLPDLPLPRFDSNAVVGSRAAYVLGTPDATLDALQLAATMALAGAGGTRASGRGPWLGVLLGLSTLGGALGAVAYLYEMIAKQKRACAYCIPAAAISFAMLPLGLAELRDGVARLRS